MRVGIGWDRHRLAAGRSCILGGFHFTDCPVGPVGHSDGDAVCHAIIDALLGAAALGDIGRHFPDSDQTWAGADSRDLLARTVVKLKEAGYAAVNVDCTVIAEQPAVTAAAGRMTAALSASLGLAPEFVSVKATRGERLGPEGRSECVTVIAVALIEEVAGS
jgi:2-C-methyl-D-erythritol 2,4-cyclodiphosphate synthase